MLTNQEIRKLNNCIEEKVPDAIVELLEKKGIKNLEDIRRNGGIPRFKGIHAKEKKTLEAHAYLNFVSENAEINEKLIKAGFRNIADITRTTQKEFIGELKGVGIKEDTASLIHAKAAAQSAFLTNVLTNLRADLANNVDMPKSLPALPYPQQCSCRECESATSPLAYLADLLDYVITHVKQTSTKKQKKWEYKRILTSMLSFLEGRFHQPFRKLPASCEEIDKKERQVRLCIEVLRSYLDDDSQYSSYLFEAYKTLLSQKGTSYDEIRMARAADPEKRKELAKRLGISLSENRRDELDRLFLTGDDLNEEELERLFGLVDTTRDPLDVGIITPDFTLWQLKHLRVLWKEQDWPVEYPENVPNIDPDVVNLDCDFRNLAVPHPGRPHRFSWAYVIWKNRRKEVDDIFDEVKNACEEDGLDSCLEELFSLKLTELDKLYENLQNGDNIEDTKKRITEELKFSLESFVRLMEIRKELEEPSQEDKKEVYAILTQVRKAGRYPDWIDEEKEKGVVIGPDEFWISIEEPELIPWLASPEIRQKWKQALKMRSQRPLLDPDLIGVSDLEELLGHAGFGLLEEREQDIEKELLNLKKRPKNKEGFQDLWIDTAWTGWDEFEQLAQKRKEGKNIEARLDQLSLTTDAFDRLAHLYKLLESNSILSSEWKEIYFIFLQLWKGRQFAIWRDEEKEKGLTLIPLLFKISEEEPDLPQWRATWEARREWQDRLEARIDQKNTVVAAQNEAVDACEKDTLPLLRDALILESYHVEDGESTITKAQWLTDHLLIDCQADACQKTTRIAQAIVTLQDLLFSLRTGQYKGGDLELDAENFDEEWKWIGSYETWKSAILTFLYPGAILFPGLRPRQSPAFRELIANLRQNRRLTPKKARELAKEYEAYFKDVCSLTLEAAVQTTNPVRIYVIARGEFTGSLYMSSYCPDDPSPDAHTFWGKIPGLEKTEVIDVVGAALYKKNEDYYIYLFLKMRKEEEKRLAYTKFDIRKGLWDAEPTSIDLPEGTKEFSGAVKQRYRKDEPPMLAISSQGVIYKRSLKLQESESDADEWEVIHAIVGGSIGELFSFIELGENPNLVALIYSKVDDQSSSTTYTVHKKEKNTWKYTGGNDLPMDVNNMFRGAFPGKNEVSFYFFWNTELSRRYRYILIDGNSGKPIKEKDMDFDTDLRKILCCNENSGTMKAVYQAQFLEEIFGCELIKKQDGGLNTSGQFKLSLFRIYDFEYIFDIFDIYITDKLTDAELDWKKDQVEMLFSANKSASATILTYLKEAFYFVPMAIALQLQKAGQYTPALDWFRTVYNYTWAVDDRKIYYGLVLEENLENGYVRPDEWLLDPLNPHTTAETRKNTYTKYTLLSIISCLLDYADAEFTRDTFESRPRARILYETALELLELDELNQHIGQCDDIIGTLVIELALELKYSRWRGVWREMLIDMRRITNVAVLEITVAKVRTIMKGPEELPVRLAEARKIVDAATKIPERTISDILEKGEVTTTEVYALLLKNKSIERGVERSALLVERSRRLAGLGHQTSSEEVTLEKSVPEAMPEKDASYIEYFRVSYIPTVLLFKFCIPRNPLIKALRFHAENNLYKLRACRNIAGVKRETELYAVNAISNMPTIGAGGQLVVPTRISQPPMVIRYQVLIERANKLVNIAAQMEAAFLSALEKRDAEYYNLLKARQDVQLAQAGVRLQDLRYYQAQDEVKLADLQKQSAQIQAGHYERLLREGISDLEQASLNMLLKARDLQMRSSTASYCAAALPASISASFPGGVSMAYSPQGSMSARASALSSIAQAYSTESSVLSIQASYERRAQEWQLQKDLALQSIRIGDQQKKIAEDGVRIAAQERNIAKMQVEHAEATVEFLANKFTNVELYDWMSGILEGVYSYFLQEATAMAKLAQSQLAFERQEPPPSFIQNDYWGVPSENPMGGATENAVDRHGLTGSARLTADIYKLDQYRLMTEERKLQLKRNISLARLAPVEFQRFKESGVMIFNTPMVLFDGDFPGHYLRLINKLYVSVIGLIPAVQGIKATLSNVGTSKVVVNNNGIFQTVTASRPPESVALTSPRDATGIFELETHSEILRPFEGLGVDTMWELRMPKAANRFEYDTIGDVIITMEYTSVSSEDYRQQVIEALPSELTSERPFSFSHQFADQWYDLHNPEQTATPMTVRFQTRREDFPPNIEELRIQHVVLYFVRANKEFEVQVSHLHFTEQGSNGFVGGGATSINGIISTRSGNAGSWIPMIGKSPTGEWELAFPDEAKDLFRNEQIEDILFVITYSGCIPEWPE